MDGLLKLLKSSPLQSREWRLQNIYTIRDAGGQLVKFKPNSDQRKFYNRFHNCNHILKARKLGFSTWTKILATDAMLFPWSNDGLSIGHIDYSLPDGKKKLKMIAEAYENLSNGTIHPDTYKLGETIQKAISLRAGKEELSMSNGSEAWCSTSLRGSTPQWLDISELGKTAIFAPIKAEEIRSGALNSITPGNVVNIESTHEGGEAGLHYELLDICMNADDSTLSEVDFRFHFFAWHNDPRYALPATGKLRPEIAAYFARLSASHPELKFTPEQMFWYDRKQNVQKYAMKKEFPTTPGEAFEAIGQFAIYGKEMADLVAAGHITNFGMEKHSPIFTFWDIGLSDYTAVWLIQPHARWFLVLDWFEAEGQPGSSMPDQMLRWENKWNKPISAHFLPHDAETRSPNDGKSYKTALADAGLRNIIVVPRTPDKWLGIGYVRDLLPHCWFHSENCDTPREQDGRKLPSGVASLKGYHKQITPANKTLREQPEHDQFSHSCDAFRTFAEAHRRGMINAPSTMNHTPRSIR